jgi:hypothetical protein
VEGSGFTPTNPLPLFVPLNKAVNKLHTGRLCIVNPEHIYLETRLIFNKAVHNPIEGFIVTLYPGVNYILAAQPNAMNHRSVGLDKAAHTHNRILQRHLL